MKANLLNLLREHQGFFLSGEKISVELNCSRTAVWKHVNALRKEGYVIDAVSNKGYQLMENGDLLSKHALLSRIKDNTLFHDIAYHDSVTSTQTIAHKLVNEDVKEGVVVVADEQTAGKGRLGRKWVSPKRSAIALSLILKPKLDFRQAPQLTLVTAVAVTRAVKQVTGVEMEIKWPNDLLLKGKKVCGILTEMQADPDRIQSIIIGIGLNVNQQHFSEEIAELATSLQKETGHTFDRAEIIAEILKEFAWLYETYLTKGFSFVKPLWEAYEITIGKEIVARTAANTKTGLAIGIDDEGVLLLQDDNQEVHRIYSADITIEK